MNKIYSSNKICQWYNCWLPHKSNSFSIIGKTLIDFNIIYFHLFLNYPFPFSFAYFYNMYSKLFPLPDCLCFQVPLLISFSTVTFYLTTVDFILCLYFYNINLILVSPTGSKLFPFFPKVLFPAYLSSIPLGLLLFYSNKLFPHS